MCVYVQTSFSIESTNRQGLHSTPCKHIVIEDEASRAIPKEQGLSTLWTLHFMSYDVAKTGDMNGRPIFI